MRYLLLLLTISTLAGCGESKPTSQQAKSTASKEDWRRIDAQRAHEAPDVIIQKLDGGEMVVLTVPTGGTAKRLDVQRCFLWRDKYYRTTSMSCPADQSGIEDSVQSGSSYSGNQGYNP